MQQQSLQAPSLQQLLGQMPKQQQIRQFEKGMTACCARGSNALDQGKRFSATSYKDPPIPSASAEVPAIQTITLIIKGTSPWQVSTYALSPLNLVNHVVST